MKLTYNTGNFLVRPDNGCDCPICTFIIYLVYTRMHIYLVYTRIK